VPVVNEEPAAKKPVIKSDQEPSIKAATSGTELESAGGLSQSAPSIVEQPEEIQTATRPAADLSPLKSREEVLVYLDRNESSFKRRLAHYNKENRIAVDGVNVWNRVSIRSMDLEELEEDRVFLRIDYMAGTGKSQRSDFAVVLFELRWIDGDLEFFGHESPL
jgi:hypothetical protein